MNWLILALLTCWTALAGERSDELSRPEVTNIAEAEPGAWIVPTPEEFQLGPGDRIAIRVWRHTDLDMDVTIAPDGSISYPLVGRIQVAGMAYPELVERLTEAIATYYEEPQVSVNILELRNQKIFVLGEVSNPSVLQLDNEMSILEALTIAGGLNSSARTRNVLLIRGGLEAADLYTVDVKSIFEGRMDQLVYLQRGDIVVVPTRTISNVARYFSEVKSVLAPFVAGSAIYRNTLSGGAQGTSSSLD
ncbi:MAG: polysaccharide biosynthesis/export family protein [Myxococcota bacterium]|nr:polysaccharide biosynthesis/export family protein [Myxococcota bacterium]